MADPTPTDPCDTEHPDQGCADIGCRHNCEDWTLRHRSADPTPTLTDAEREQRCRREQISHEHYAREDVERIVAAREAAVRADERERLVTAAKQIVHAAIDRAESNVGGLLIVLDEISALAQAADTEGA